MANVFLNFRNFHSDHLLVGLKDDRYSTFEDDVDVRVDLWTVKHLLMNPQHQVFILVKGAQSEVAIRTKKLLECECGWDARNAHTIHISNHEFPLVAGDIVIEVSTNGQRLDSLEKEEDSFGRSIMLATFGNTPRNQLVFYVQEVVEEKLPVKYYQVLKEHLKAYNLSRGQIKRLLMLKDGSVVISCTIGKYADGFKDHHEVMVISDSGVNVVYQTPKFESTDDGICEMYLSRSKKSLIIKDLRTKVTPGRYVGFSEERIVTTVVKL